MIGSSQVKTTLHVVDRQDESTSNSVQKCNNGESLLEIRHFHCCQLLSVTQLSQSVTQLNATAKLLNSVHTSGHKTGGTGRFILEFNKNGGRNKCLRINGSLSLILREKNKRPRNCPSGDYAGSSNNVWGKNRQ